MGNRAKHQTFYGQRSGTRRKIKWQAAVKYKKYKNAIPAVTLNISAQGVLLETPVLIKVGEKVPIMIVIDYFEHYFTIYADTKVRHSFSKELDCYIGLQFIKLNITYREFLTRFAEGSI
ncbi:PilZ domain-containing protein [Spartinivicinus ruber]|uniref:PilZ domain-containing protein n=1 Tax=Spartinivicinus ruber TaxID=2683272 RepID=UPI0013D1E98E|nr:PilZ domain-containing protein [Spartinivicinus ruber]